MNKGYYDGVKRRDPEILRVRGFGLKIVIFMNGCGE